MNYPLILLVAGVGAAYAWAILSAIRSVKNVKKPKRRDGVPLTEALLGPFARPAIAITRGTSAFSRIGGLPDLPTALVWPVDPKGRSLAFLCQISLEELPAVSRDIGLPNHGALFFFYCQDQAFGGNFPDHAAGWRALYSPETPPSGPRTAPLDIKPKSIYKPASVGFSSIVTYVDLDEAQLDALGVGDNDYMAFVEKRERPSPLHMIGGCPDNLHGVNMEENCELASNGIPLHDRTAYNSPEALALRERPRDWRLLLQLDSDDEAGMNWGDGGILYFWIRAADLAENDFSKVWMIAQCH